ncbi:MAG: macrocin O-methyltransferase [Sulfurimonas sp.]|nr:macrocin O-methyltransferase [Sulfurimonas sp.]
MNYLSSMFWGVRNPGFFEAMQQAIDNTPQQGIYTGDNLFTFSKNLSFLNNKPFMDAYNKHVTTEVEKAILWRIYVVAWAAKSVISRNIPGDFVECACYKGTTARIVSDYVDFAKQEKSYYLYDLFEHDESMMHHAMPEHSATLFEQVKNRFADLSNVIVTKGHVPNVLHEVSPQKVSLLHIDLNNAAAEIGALEILFDRLSPGGILILDDYGWLGYREQKLAEDPWLAKRGYEVLELPTGQGVIFK